MSNGIKDVIAKALDGEAINAGEIQMLLEVPALSRDSYLIQHASRQMGEEANQGKAEVHGQAGIDTGPCRKNCAFCAFAACNGVFPRPQAAMRDKVVEDCLSLEREGANAIYLMATAAFSFREYLAFGRTIRSALRPDTVLVANTGDFDGRGAEALLRAGFTGIYHAVRLGEGSVTGIKPEERLSTITAARNAGLLVGTCVEPVGPEHTPEELAKITVLTRELGPVFSGAARRVTIPGTTLARHGMVNESRMALILAVVRLAAGYGIQGNCTHEPNGIGAMAGANVFWAENGSNPRDTKNKTENGRGFSVAECREIFREAGWDTLVGPSRMFHPCN
ncbi:MAG: radical SAM protein [Bacillota bacterium]